MVSVRQSKNPCLVGLSGIVIYESENGFRVITRGNKLKSASISPPQQGEKYNGLSRLVLPKQNTVFAFGVPLHSTVAGGNEGGTVLDCPHFEIELYGNQFRFRSSDRASRKFKHKETLILL